MACSCAWRTTPSPSPAARSTGCTWPARATCAARTSASSARWPTSTPATRACTWDRAAARRHPRPRAPPRDGVEVPRRLRRGDVLRLRPAARRGRHGDDARAPRDDPVGQGLKRAGGQCALEGRLEAVALRRRSPRSARCSGRRRASSVAIWLAYAGRSTTRQSIGSGGTPAARASRRARRSARTECPKAMTRARAARVPCERPSRRPATRGCADACRGGTRPRRGSSGARRPTASRSTTAARPRARARRRRAARRACGTCAGTTPSGPGRRSVAASRRAPRRAGPTHRRPAPRRRPRRDAGRARAGTAPSWRAAGDAPACRPARGSTPIPRPGQLAPARRDLAPGARVDHHEPRVAELAREAPAAVADLPALGVHPRREQLGGVAGRAYLVVEPARRELGGRQVAEVLEDPVGHQPGADVIVEPRLGVHLVQPALRDTPLGVDLVVVEDHRHRHRREQPADRRLRPRLAVGQRVLAEVGQLVARRRRPGAPAPPGPPAAPARADRHRSGRRASAACPGTRAPPPAPATRSA